MSALPPIADIKANIALCHKPTSATAPGFAGFPIQQPAKVKAVSALAAAVAPGCLRRHLHVAVRRRVDGARRCNSAVADPAGAL